MSEEEEEQQSAVAGFACGGEKKPGSQDGNKSSDAKAAHSTQPRYEIHASLSEPAQAASACRGREQST
jgi:hypothetical protein